MNADQLGVVMIFGDTAIIALAVYVYNYVSNTKLRLAYFSGLFLAMFLLWYFAAGTGMLNG